jgi:hypothetical protein
VSGSPTVTAPAASTIKFSQYGFTTIVPGSVNYANVEFNNYTGYDLAAGTMNVGGNLVFTANTGFGSPINNGTLNVSGNVDVSAGGLNGTATIVLTGNASGQTIIGGGNPIPNLQINTGANAVTITGNVVMSCNLAVTSVGTFTVSSSTLTWKRGSCDGGTSNISPGSVTYGNVELNGYNNTVDLGGNTWNVGGTLALGDSNNTYGINNGTIAVVGDITVNHGGNFGTANIQAVSSPSGQTIYGNGLMIPNLEIAAGTNPVTLNGVIEPCVFKYTSSGTFTTTGSTLQWLRGTNSCDTGGGSIINIYPGTVTYNNVVLNPYDSDVSLNGGTWNIAGTLTIGSGRTSAHVINSGTISATGDIHLKDNGFDGGTASVVMAGNPSGQTIYGNGYNIPNLTIAAGTNPVTLNGVVGSFGNFTMTSVGTFTVTGSTLNIGGASASNNTITPGTVTYNNVNISEMGFEIIFGNYDLGGGTMNVGGQLTMGTWGFGYNLNNGTFNVAGGFSNQNDGYGGNAVINFVGSNAQAVSSTGSVIPGGNVTVNSTGGGSITLNSDVSWNNVGQSLTVASGTVYMAGHAMAVNNVLTINSGATVTKSGGTLTYGSLVNNGTLNP